MAEKRLRIYLFRHGHTYYNESKIFTGWKDSKLTLRGIKEARIISRKLKKIRVDIAFSSSLGRSKETLREVLKEHPECKKVIVDDRMRERSYGRLEGKSHKSIIEKYGQEQFDKWHRGYDVRPPGGESIKDVEKRVVQFVKELVKLMKKEKVNVAVSAHGNSMRPFRRYFEKLSVGEMMKL
ncbi:MAG: histidine phosphatase family protein, partial [Nanoarchaeota archaeon]